LFTIVLATSIVRSATDFVARKWIRSSRVVGFSSRWQQRELPLRTASVESGWQPRAEIPVSQQLWSRHELVREEVRMVEFTTGYWCYWFNSFSFKFITTCYYKLLKLKVWTRELCIWRS